MALYRTYRPHTFNDVCGQDHIISTLQRAVETDQLSHAYLFAGSRGTGKTSVARILAKSLMIRGIEDETLQKQISQGVDEGSIVDLLEIDAASNRGIDDVRDLIEKIQFSPVVASAKVYIIDEVHMLTKEAFNALLKTLEEPPEYAYFILATTELNKIPMTIQSRCQCYPFRRIKESDIITRLQFIADQEKISNDREALRAIAHHSNGGLRDAISLLDQLRSLDHISVNDVHERIGATGHEYVEGVFAAIDAGDPAAVVEHVRKVEEAGVPLDIFVRHLLGLVREHLHEAVAKQDPIDGILATLDTLLQAIVDVRTAPVPGLVLEAALVSLCTGESAVPVSNDTVTTKKSESPPVAESEPKSSSSLVEAPPITLESVQHHWPDVLKATKPAAVKMSLKNGQVTAVADNTITLTFASAFHRDQVKDTQASRGIEEVLQQIFKQALTIRCQLDGGSDDKADSGSVVNLAEAAAEIF